MKVKTLINEEFSNTCLELSKKISSDFQPDLIIGILTGGGYVGRKIHEHLTQNQKICYTEIKIQREGTSKKGKGFLKLILKYSPTFLLNWMRIIESIMLEKKSKKNNPKREGKIILPPTIDSFLKQGNKNILLVDDAIDSGATLNLIKEHIYKNYQNSNIKIAVITITTKNPIISADYYIYNNRTLIRFPWSNDIKKKNAKRTSC